MNIKITKLNEELSKKYKKDIVNLIYENFRSHIVSYKMEDAEIKYEEMFSYLINRLALVFVAIKENEVIGFVWSYKHYYRESTNRLYISIIQVNENYRNRKIGKSLMLEVKSYASLNNIEYLFLHVDADNTKGVNFYNKFGFKHERIQMVKRIKHD